MVISDIYQKMAYLLWSLGGVFLIATIVIFFKYKVMNIIHRMTRCNDIMSSSYMQKSNFNNTTMLLQANETEALTEETQLLSANNFSIIFQIIETHSNEMI